MALGQHQQGGQLDALIGDADNLHPVAAPAIAAPGNAVAEGGDRGFVGIELARVAMREEAFGHDEIDAGAQHLAPGGQARAGFVVASGQMAQAFGQAVPGFPPHHLRGGQRLPVGRSGQGPERAAGAVDFRQFAAALGRHHHRHVPGIIAVEILEHPAASHVLAAFNHGC